MQQASNEQGQEPFPTQFSSQPGQEEKKAPSSQARQYERESFKIPVRLKIEKKEISGYTHDISPGGLLIYSDAILSPGTPMTLQFSFGDICYLNISGQIVFCRLAGSNETQIYAVGLKFVAIREWEQKILDSAVKELRQRAIIQTQEKTLLTILVSKDVLALETKDFYIQTRRTEVERQWPTRQSCTHASRIIGLGSYLPPNKITNQDLNLMLNVNGSKKKFGDVIGNLTGIKTRRYAGSNIYPSDLAVEASLIALKNAGVDPKDLEVVISCGVARDVEEPATAYIIQEKLGAYNAYCFDLANACNGFISAIDVLDSFIASGRCEVGLVAAGDVLSQYITWAAKSKEDLHMSSMSYTLSDGGGAAVLQRVKDGEEQGIRARWFLSDGSYWKVAVVPLMDTDRRYFKSNAANIEDAALKHVPTGVEEVMNMLNWNLNDIKLIIPHQVSLPIIENLFYERLGIPPEKIYWSFPRHGNVGAASMPVALCEALNEGRVQEGDKILFVGGSGGFGAGVLGLIL